jgi:ferric-dicitrate binding protein FerR (iron transport regulator)
MENIFQTVEDVLADELFQAWYFKTDAQKAKTWETWVKDHPAQQELVDKAISCMQAIIIKEQELPAGQIEASGRRLMEKLSGAEVPVINMNKRPRRWWGSAAAAILLVIAGTYLFTTLNGQSSIKTAYGQVSQQQLPDGSEVVLNANSSISYSSDWDKGNEREVWIKGEAFFHVKKTSNKSRFIVHTNQLDIVVTGTQFNVVSRAEKTSVMLTEGSVLIRTKDGKETRMAPGDFVELEHSQLAKKTVNGEVVLAWKDKKLIFEETPITEAAQKIKEHYGQEIEIDQSVSHKTISAMMPNDNLDVLLKSLEATLEYKVIRKDGRIIITNPQ